MPTEIDDQPLGILAGEGALPLQLIDCCQSNNIPVCVVQFDGCDYGAFPNVPTIKTRIEKVGKIFDFLKSQGTKNIVMIGNLQRPSIKSFRPDFRGIKTLVKIAGAFLKGDDNLLRSLKTEIESQGFAVRGVDYYLHDLIAEEGTLTDMRSSQNMNKAISESLRYGSQDKGQSILLHIDGSYSYETREGTTALIETHGRTGSVLVKMVKPQQDRDLDRPTVGLQTLKSLRAQECAGMVIQANGVLMVNRPDMVDFANKNKLFIEAVRA